MKMWRRNAVAAMIVLFVCMAVYLNWSYQNGETADTDKTLGEAILVNGQISDPLMGGTVANLNPVSSASPEAGTTGGGSYFDSARLNRRQTWDSALAVLQDSTTSRSADETMKEANDETIQTLTSYTVSEVRIENLATAKGYTDRVAFIGDESVDVMVSTRKDGLIDADVAKITEIVTDEARIEASQVKIIEVEGQVVLEHAVKNQLQSLYFVV